MERARPQLRARRHAQGRHGLLALQLGDHRLAQGRDPPAPRHARGRRHVRPATRSACKSRTCRSRWPSCSSPTGWATGCTFRCAPAARRCCCPIGPRPTRFSPPSTAISRRVLLRRAHQLRGAVARGGEGRTNRASGRVRMCVSAGETLPRHIFEKWRERFGVEILDGIGSTEILHIFISNRPGKAKAGSTGQVVPGFEAKIVDEAGRELPAGPRRHAHDQGRQHRHRLLEPARGHASAPSAASGSIRTTSSWSTRTAISGTPAAPTTCSK